MYPYGNGQTPQQPPLYGQATGYQQQTGYPSYQQQQQQQQQTGAQMPLMTGSYGQYQQQQQPLQPQQPLVTGSYSLQSQPTGFLQQQQPQNSFGNSALTGSTSSMIAPPDSATATSSNGTSGPGPKIPNVRLSFITADDQKKFEQLFRSAINPNENALAGNRAKEILLRSSLNPAVLADVWQLADTTKSGVLLFPEFALAMYLCSLVIKGQSLPASLPETIKNEVSSLVDIISFSLADDGVNGSTSSIPSYVPDFSSRNDSGLNSQPTGANSQQTGFVQPAQRPSFSSQPTGLGGYSAQPLQQQQTGGFSQPLQSQLTGAGFSQQSLQSQVTGGFQQQPLQPQQQQQPQPLQQEPTGGFQPLQPQTTGGFQSLQQQPTGYSQPLQPQSASIPVQNTGYGQPLQNQATGLQPLQAMPTGKPGQWGFINTPGQGLPGIEALKTQLMPQKTGLPANSNFSMSQLQGNATVEWSITKDEKQIYDSIFNAWDRQRAGFVSGEIAIDVLGKSGLNRGDLETIWTLADPDNRGRLSKDEFAVAMHLIYRRLNGYPLPSRLPPELVPPSQRRLSESVSQIKSFLRSNSMNSEITSTTSSTNANQRNADAAVFKNNDDEMGGYVSSARHRSRKGERDTSKPSYEDPDKMSVAELKKAVNEKQILLDAIDAKDEDNYSAVSDLEARDSQSIELLKTNISNIQQDINKFPNASSLSEDASFDKRQALRKLHAQTDLVPQLLSSIQKIDEEVIAAKLELFRRTYEKEHPGTTIAGTGPGGLITEWDRKKARSKAVLRRVAAMTGRGSNEHVEESDVEKFEELYSQERDKIGSDQDRNARMFKEIQDSISQLTIDLERDFKESNEDISTDRERRRFEEAIGVEDSVKDFIYSLRRLPSAAPAQPARDSAPRASLLSSTNLVSNTSTGTVNGDSKTSSGAATTHMSPVDRAKYIKAEAERKMAEKLAALGIVRKPKNSASAFQPPSSTSTPSSETPPTQPSQPIKSTPAASEKQRAPEPVPEKLYQTPPVAPVQVEEDSSDDEDEKELIKVRAEQEARLKQLEANATAKNLKKQQKEERRKALLAEIETAKERERQLLAQQNKTDDEDEDEDQIPTPVTSRPSGTGHNVTAAVKTPPAASGPTSAEAEPESHNPFLRGKNPFFRPPDQTPTTPVAKNSAPASAMSVKETIDPTEAAAQRRKQTGQSTDDEWGDGKSESGEAESSEDEDSSRGNPAQLASILFGSMGGKTTSAVSLNKHADDDSKSSSAFATPLSSSVNLSEIADAPKSEKSGIQPASLPPPVPTFNQEPIDAPKDLSVPFQAPPPPPPAPPVNAPPPPPPFPTGSNSTPVSSGGPPPAPPPPPPPTNGGISSVSASVGGAPDTAGLFADIVKGRALRKVPEAQQKKSNQDLGKVL